MVAAYFSVETPSSTAANQQITFTFTPTNASSNTPQTTTVNITASQSEISIAQSIQSQLTAFFVSNGTLWQGQPPLSSSSPTNTFQVTITDHVVCVWSDCQFFVSITNNSSIDLEQSAVPLLLTLQDLTNRAPIHRIVLQDMSGNTLPAATQVLLIRDASAALVSFLNNNIVATSYLEAYSGRGGKMLKGRYRPGLSWDVPTSRQMWQLVANTLATNPRTLWNWKDRQNELWFRLENSLISIYDPNDIGSEIKWSYVAGYWFIPDEIKGAVAEIARKILTQTDAAKFRLGALSVDNSQVKEWLGVMNKTLRKYML